jgi:hypothetical protein
VTARRFAICCLALAFAASPVRAQQPTQQFTVAGTVVSALTHQPVPRAMVELALTTEPKRSETVSADSEGHFTFHDVPAGKFRLTGQAAGFLQSTYQQHGTFSTAIVTGAAVPTNTLQLELRPLGEIFGTIRDESAEPVANAQVHLFREDRTSGAMRIVPAQTTTTNDLGHFQFARVQPGTFLLAVTGQPWYAVHPNPGMRNGGYGVVDAVDPALNAAYPITYYPGAIDAARAGRLSVNGNRVEADLQLAPVPAVSVTLPSGTGQPTQVFSEIFGQRVFTQSQVFQTSHRGSVTTVTVSGLAPGDYTVQSFPAVAPRAPGAQMQPPRRPAQPTVAGHIHVTEQGDSSLTLAEQSASVHLAIHTADGSQLPANLQAALVPVRDQQAELDPEVTPVTLTPADPKGELDLTGEPGDFYLRITGGGRLLVQRALTLDEKPVPDATLHLRPGSRSAVSVAIVRGRQTIRGVVSEAGTPQAGIMLLLLPAEAHADLRMYYRQQSDLDGSFDIQNLAPGPYLLLALRDGWTINWHDPGVLGPLLARSLPVEIPASGADLALPLPIAPR